MSGIVLKKRLALRVGVATTVASLLVSGWLFSSGPALGSEKTPPPSASGGAIAEDDTDVTLSDVVEEGAIAPMAVQNVGGGTWHYGSYLQIYPPKTCYSNYTHNTKYHSSTAIIHNSSSKRYANAGSWSYASTWAGAAYTCYAYWATY